MTVQYRICEVDQENYKSLAKLFHEFWPDETNYDKEVIEAGQLLEDPDQTAYLVSIDQNYVGFVHITIRHEYVEGKTTPYVGYIEGIYLRPAFQNQGIGRALIEMAEKWALSKGCTQIGSDTEIENTNSIAFHEKMGYKVNGRFVTFMKDF